MGSLFVVDGYDIICMTERRSRRITHDWSQPDGTENWSESEELRKVMIWAYYLI